MGLPFVKFYYFASLNFNEKMDRENQNEAFQPIDIVSIVSAKNPKLAKQIPGFVYRYLSRILHLKEINRFLIESGHLRDMEFIDAGIEFLNIKFEQYGLENLPNEGKQIYVSNHPLGGLDGMLLLQNISKHRGTIRTIANDFLMAITPVENLFVPVNKVGSQARGTLQTIENLYSAPDQILIFPAGLCSRKVEGKIVDLEWQKHFIQKSIQHKIDVVPIFFEGKNSNFFYNLARIRKFLGIKFNIEMMYLSDEMFKHRNKTFKIYYGNPISYTEFDKSRSHKEWAKHVKEIAYKLPKEFKA
jgi:putative hemolysin